MPAGAPKMIAVHVHNPAELKDVLYTGVHFHNEQMGVPFLFGKLSSVASSFTIYQRTQPLFEQAIYHILSLPRPDSAFLQFNVPYPVALLSFFPIPSCVQRLPRTAASGAAYINI